MAEGKTSTVPATKTGATAEAMHRAGFPPWLTLVVVVLSTPGVWGFFADKSETAEAKAEVGYEILRQTVEGLKEDNAALKAEIQENERRIFSMMSSVRRHGRHGDMDGDGESASEPVEEAVDDVLDAAIEAEEPVRDMASKPMLPSLSDARGPKSSVSKARGRLPASLDMAAEQWIQKKAF